MSSNRKGPKRLTPTTVILVLVLLGAVAGASRLVSPPPPGPPEVKPPSPPQTASKEKMKSMQEAEMMKNKEMMMKAHMSATTSKIPVVPDPAAMVIDNKYFINTKPGEAGLKQVEEQQKRKTADYQAYLKKRAAAEGKAPVPQDKPIAAPAK